MKKILFAMAAIIIVAFTSCSSSNEPKEISPTSTDFTSGELAKLIEVVDEPCQLSYAEQDGAIGTQFIKLKVKLRLTKESPELREVDAHDIDFTGLLSVATVNLVDANETKVQDIDVKSEDLLKLKKLLQGEKGDEETIIFQGEFHNSKDAPKWYEQTAAFTPYLTGDVVVGDEVTTPVSNSFEIDGTHDMHGTVDKYPITMHLEIDGSIIKGTYYYDKQGSNAKLKLSGTNIDGILDVNETDADGTPTGHFKGKYSDGMFIGMFITNQGKKLPFQVSEDGASVDDLSLDTDDSDYTSSSSYDEIIERFATFVSKLEGVKSIDESYLEQLENEYKEINKLAEGISVYDLSPTQQKRIRELKSKLEKESERIKDMRYGF
jgi:hypothetical protein